MPERGAVEGKVETTPFRIPIVLLVDVIFRPRVHPRLEAVLIGRVGHQAKLTRQPVVRYAVIRRSRLMRPAYSGTNDSLPEREFPWRYAEHVSDGVSDICEVPL